MTTETEEYVPLKGEGDVQYVKRTRSRRDCEVCGEPADYRLSFLLENARRNPASSGYGGDDISWCSDAEKFVCKAHRDEHLTPDGYQRGGIFTLSGLPHMGLYWRDEIMKPETTGPLDAAKVNERIRALMASNADLVEALGRIAEGDVIARLKKKSWTSLDVITQYQAIASAVLAKHESQS